MIRKSIRNVFKTFYNAIPLKQQVFTTVKRFYSPPESVYKHLHFKGKIEIPVDDTHRFKMIHYGYQIENEVFWSGIRDGWEKHSLRIWIELSKKSNVIFDLGANTGIFCLTAQAVNPNAKVFALEPVKRVFEKLVKNTAINHYDIECLQVAASNSTGTAIIYDTDLEHTTSVTVNKNWFPPEVNVHEETIDIDTMDAIVEKFKIEKIDLIKLDVETHEPEVLEGYSKYLKKHSPTMLLEVLNNELGVRIQNILESSGCNYLYFNIDETNGIRQIANIRRTDSYNFLACSEEIARELKLID